LIIACIGDIFKLQLYIWSSYGLLAEIKKIFSLSSPLFFEVYGLTNLLKAGKYATQEKCFVEKKPFHVTLRLEAQYVMYTHLWDLGEINTQMQRLRQHSRKQKYSYSTYPERDMLLLLHDDGKMLPQSDVQTRQSVEAI
jgi:hypothetical protein